MKEIVGQVKIPIKAYVSMSVKSYLSNRFIRAAILFSNKAGEIEHAFKQGDKKSQNRNEHLSYVIGAVILAVTFLESYINEYISDTHNWKRKAGEKTASQNTSNSQNSDIPKILRKYSTALSCAGKDGFVCDKPPWKDIRLLIRIRNALVHYEPREQLICEPASIRDKMERFRECDFKGKFDFNPLASAGGPFFYDKCLGHGCAEWSIKSSIAFVEEFSKRMGIDSRLAGIINELNNCRL
jgi:hypothetical protein